MADTEFFTTDEHGNVISKTNIHPDGSVSRYPYTTPDQIKKGHGHQEWGSMDDYLQDEKPDWQRSKNAKKSINRHWSGPGYDLALEVLNNLSLEELQELFEVSSGNYVHTSEEMLIRSAHKQLVLK